MRLDMRPVRQAIPATLPAPNQEALPPAVLEQLGQRFQLVPEAEFQRALAQRQRAVRLALQAYTDGTPPTPEDRAQGLMPLPVQVFTDAGLNLKLLAHVADGTLTLAFRGTVGAFLFASNWSSVNLQAGKTGSPPRHAGFQRAWVALHTKLLPWLATQEVQAVHLVGHSMGAALAQLAALELSAAWPVQSVTLLAPPMLGTAEFNRHYDETLVASSQVALATLTTRYLMLSDVISVPLPRLAGFVPGEPVCVIDKLGRSVHAVPGLLDQTLGQLAHSDATTPATGLLRGQLLPGTVPAPDLGPASILEQAMPTWRVLAMGQGTVAGWAALGGVAAMNVLWRAVGFHAMDGYDRALGPPRMRLG